MISKIKQSISSFGIFAFFMGINNVKITNGVPDWPSALQMSIGLLFIITHLILTAIIVVRENEALLDAMITMLTALLLDLGMALIGISSTLPSKAGCITAFVGINMIEVHFGSIYLRHKYERSP